MRPSDYKSAENVGRIICVISFALGLIATQNKENAWLNIVFSNRGKGVFGDHLFGFNFSCVSNQCYADEQKNKNIRVLEHLALDSSLIPPIE